MFSLRHSHDETSSERYKLYKRNVLYPLQRFKHQVECIPVWRIIGYLRKKSASNFFPLGQIPPPRISLSPYSDDYSPNNKKRTVYTSLVALLCKRLSQDPYRVYVIQRNKDALRIFMRILLDAPKLETDPHSVFFQYVKMEVTPTVPHIWITSDERYIYVYRRHERDSRLSKPFAVYQIKDGYIWHYNENTWRAITPELSWSISRFGKFRLSDQGPKLAVMIDEYLVFIDFNDHTTTLQKVGWNGVFHPRLPFIWMPATKKNSSRLLLINPSWNKATAIAYGRQDRSKHPY
jgi:hypothetical protein